MIETLKEILESKKLYGYKIKKIHTYRYELYFIKQELDMNRYVDVNEYEITIYKTINDENIGIASTTIDDSYNKEQISDKIDELIENANYAVNKKFDLVKKVNFKNIVRDVNFQKFSLKDAAFMLADEIFEVDKYDKGYINSCEIFVNFQEVEFYNSLGIEYKTCHQFAEIELITTWSGTQEVELYKFIELDNLNYPYINATINKMFIDAKNRSNALPTNEMKNTRVMFSEEALKQFFEFFINKCNCQYIYQRLSDYQVGKNIFNSKQKKETFSIDAIYPLNGSTSNLSFDEDGVVFKPITLIDKGVVKNLWGSQKYCSYLKVPVTGNYKNFKVSTGTSKIEDINFDYLEIVSLSGLEIDPLTGDFGSEIRLAYYHSKNKTKYYSGGTISGNVYKSLENLLISEESYQLNNFVGPKYIIISNVNVSKR